MEQLINSLNEKFTDWQPKPFYGRKHTEWWLYRSDNHGADETLTLRLDAAKENIDPIWTLYISHDSGYGGTTELMQTTNTMTVWALHLLFEPTKKPTA